MNCLRVPEYCWLLCLEIVVFVLNHTAVESQKWRTPIERLTGKTPDISVIMQLHSWRMFTLQTIQPQTLLQQKWKVLHGLLSHSGPLKPKSKVHRHGELMAMFPLSPSMRKRWCSILRCLWQKIYSPRLTSMEESHAYCHQWKEEPENNSSS